METIKTVAFIVGLFVFCAWIFSRKWMADEERRNASHEAPSEQQLRWHIRHLRQDVHALVLINMALLLLVAGAVFFKL